jgi:hypothetical protein
MIKNIQSANENTVEELTGKINMLNSIIENKKYEEKEISHKKNNNSNKGNKNNVDDGNKIFFKIIFIRYIWL